MTVHTCKVVGPEIGTWGGLWRRLISAESDEYTKFKFFLSAMVTVMCRLLRL